MKSLFKKNSKQELQTVMCCLMIICISCIVIWLVQAMHLCFQLGKDNTDGFIWEFVSRGITLLTMALCSLFIWIMLSNVKREQVFTSQNADLILAIGTTVEFAGILRFIVGYFASEGGAERETFMIFLLLGVFILFIGCLFKMGIRMKEEQDLTI